MTSSINNIRTLMDEIHTYRNEYLTDDNRQFSNYEHIMEKYIGTDWENYIPETLSFISPTDYAKVLIHEDNYYKLYLICWLPGQHAPLHGHQPLGCLVKVLSGTVFQYLKTNMSAKRGIYQTFESGTMTYLDNSIGRHIFGSIYRHWSTNSERPTAYTLHLYPVDN